MNFSISIANVDGETSVNGNFHDPKSVLDFLHDFDHEGASITMSVYFENNEEIYNFLKEKTNA